MKKYISLLILLICSFTFNSENSLCQWEQTGGFYGGYVSSLTSSGSNIIAGTSGNGVYLTSNNGTNWMHVAFSSQIIFCLLTNGSYVYAGAMPNMYRSSNNGLNWSQIGTDTIAVSSLAAIGENIFIGSYFYGVFLTTNYGSTWSHTSLNNKDVFSLLVSGTNLFAGTYLSGVYLSTNNGSTWTQRGLNNRSIISLAASGGYIFAGTDTGLYRSSNNGQNWIFDDLRYGRTFIVNGTNVFTGTDIFGVLLTTNYGSTWIQKNTGFTLPLPEVMSLCIANGYIFAGVNVNTTSSFIWRRTYSEIIGIRNITENIPDKFMLCQNYPNPFNPTTKIRFDVPQVRHLSGGSSPHGFGGDLITLKVFDVMGRELQTLVNEKLSPGTYEATFNASALPSGVYFYKLQSGDYTMTKRMTLIK